MRTASHLDKVDRISALCATLDPDDHFEIWYWATLTAATNAYNACLHLAGITPDDPVFSTVPGVHMVRQADDSYRRELRGPGDVSHVGWPPIPGPLPRDIEDLETAIHAIEHYRDRCLRGTTRPTRGIVNDVRTNFGTVLELLAARRERPVRIDDPPRPEDRASATVTRGAGS